MNPCVPSLSNLFMDPNIFSIRDHLSLQSKEYGLYCCNDPSIPYNEISGAFWLEN